MKKAIRSELLCGFLMGIICLLLLPGEMEAAPPIRVGAISAWDYHAGQGVKKGTEIAIRDINAAGGLLGRQLEGVYYDNRLSIDESKKALERLLYSDKVDVICGFWKSDLAVASQPMIMEAKKVFLIASGAAEVLYENVVKNYETYKYSFTCQVRTGISMHSQGDVPMNLVDNQLGLGKWAVLAEKAAWVEPVYTMLTKDYKDKVVYATRISSDATDYSVEFSRAKAAGANVLYFACTGKGQLVGIKQWYDMQLPMPMVAMTTVGTDPTFMELTEGKGDGVIAIQYLGNSGFDITPKTLPFSESYKKMFGTPPTAFTVSTTYDIMGCWAEGVKLAKTIDSDAVVKAMESAEFKYEGVLGIVERFDKMHCPVGGGWKEGEAWGTGLVQWHKNGKGKMSIIWPDQYKAGSIVLPERLKKLMGK